MLTITILGSNAYSQNLEIEARKALDSLPQNIPYEIIRVYNPNEVAAYGVHETPTLIINGRVFSKGIVPNHRLITKWMTEPQVL